MHFLTQTAKSETLIYLKKLKLEEIWRRLTHLGYKNCLILIRLAPFALWAQGRTNLTKINQFLGADTGFWCLKPNLRSLRSLLQRNLSKYAWQTARHTVWQHRLTRALLRPLRILIKILNVTTKLIKKIGKINLLKIFCTVFVFGGLISTHPATIL